MHIPRFLAVLAAAALFSVPAFADSLTLTLLNPNQSIPAGQTSTFNATVTSTSASTIFLNGDSFSISGPFTLDDSDFFNNFPFALSPGQSFTGALFTLTDTASAGTSVYIGSFTLLGGANPNASLALGSATFPAAANAVTPEPSSLMLLATGASALMTFGKRRIGASR